VITKQDLAAEEATAEEEATAAETPTASDGPAMDGGAERGWLGRARIMVVMAALLVAALAATAALQWMSASQARDSLARLESERALRLEVSGAASSFGKALLSYDYQDLQATRATLTAQATGDFLATYDEAFGGAMAQVIVKLKAVSEANVREVYLSDVDEATAHAIVVVDQQVNTSEAIRSVKDSHLKISLVKEKGVWKVHDVSVLGAAKEDQYKLDSGSKKKG
jgi:Mce-associated membrane protein